MAEAKDPLSRLPDEAEHNVDPKLYQLEGRPPLREAVPLGLQHILAMFTGNLAPIFIIANLVHIPEDQKLMMIQCAMLISGIGTLVQLYPIRLGRNVTIGAGLPLVMGTSFAFVPVMQTVGGLFGVEGIMGASLAAGVIVWALGFLYKYIKVVFSPLIIGCVLVTIGVRLLGTGAEYFAGGKGAPDFGSVSNIALASAVFFTVTLVQHFCKGMLKNMSILIGLIVGYILAIIMGKIDLSSVEYAKWFSLPQPFYITPEFHIDAILGFIAVFVVVTLETAGNASTVTMAAFDRAADNKETKGAILANAFSSQLAAVFNAFPSTAFSQNVGIVAMNKIINKFAMSTGAVVLLVAAFMPKLGTAFAAMPASVLGGAVITVFSMILINGVRLIARSGFSQNNLMILGITFGIGYGLASVHLPITITPDMALPVRGVLYAAKTIFEEPVTAVCVVSLVSSLLLRPSKKTEKAAA